MPTLAASVELVRSLQAKLVANAESAVKEIPTFRAKMTPLCSSIGLAMVHCHLAVPV